MAVSPINMLDVEDYTAHVERAAGVLREGGVVVLPTETIYGAAAVLTCAAGLDRLRKLHPAPQAKPFVIHLSTPADALDYIDPPGELGRRMIHKLWPGPVGLIFDVCPTRQAEVAAELGLPIGELYDGPSITLRCPDHPVASAILVRVGDPVVIRRAPDDGQSARGVCEAWGSSVDMVIDAGAPAYLKPSTLIHVMADGYRIERAGVYDQRIVERMLKTTVLFVCSGNTCRSPMAEALARKIIADKLGVPLVRIEDKGFSVMSAGAFAMSGARATAAAVEAVAQHGADLSQHRSRPLTVEMIHQADEIFAMSPAHAAAVRALVPSAAARVHTLDPENEIEDPIGGDAAMYNALAIRLKDLIEKRLAERSIP